jgi:putative ABC transport system permease protein
MIRASLRSLKRDPGLVLGVIATFALAIGTNAAMFGLVTRLLLPAPPGVAEPAHVARTRMTTSFPAFREIASRRELFSDAAAARDLSIVLGRAEEAEEVKAVAASGSYFSVLGARPALGRFFTAADDELPSGNPVAVLSYAFWKKRFAGEPAAVGTTVSIDGNPFTVIGVAAPNFSGDNIAQVDLFVPISAALRTREPGWWQNAQIHVVSVVVRMRDGVTQAAASVAAGMELESLLPAAVRNSAQARIARWLLGVSLVVLLIATANVGTLLLLRALRQRRDVAVRIALGATRSRLAIQLTVESLLLALAGGTAGVMVSSWLAEVVRRTLLPDLAPSDRLVDGVLLAVTFGLALLAGVVAGLAPIFLVAQRHITADLTGSGALGSARRSRAQHALVGVQVALCTVLLVGAGLFVRSLQRVQSQELGYSPARLLFVTLDFRERLGGAREDAVYREAVDRVSRLRGVTAASVVQAMPFGSFHVPPLSVPGLDDTPTVNGQPPFLYAATPEYLRLMDVTLLQGRLLEASDRRGSMLVVLVNETFAREVWPGQNALGKCIRAGHDAQVEPSMVASSALPCRTVVGVVRDSRARSLRPVGREASLMQYYVPFEQVPAFPFADDPHEVNGMLVGTAGEPSRLAADVQRMIQGSVSTPVYARVRPYQELLDPQLRPWRLGATLFVAFGALALAIAAVGLFGVVSYLVSQRTREIGLRLALGGTGGIVGRAVVLGAVRMVALGLGIGLVAAVLAAPAAQSLLFETTPRDTGVLLVASVSLVLVAIGAAAIPAWRAARVSPMVALRVD